VWVEEIVHVQEERFGARKVSKCTDSSPVPGISKERQNTMKRRRNEHSERIVSLDEVLPGTKLENLDDAGQSGDTQGLSAEEDIASESVKELAEDDQPYEAETLAGVEQAGDDSERPVQSHEDRRPWNDNELPPEPDWK
jgi:hypothetical protein